MAEMFIDANAIQKALSYSLDEMCRSFQLLLREVQNRVPPIPKLHIPKQPRFITEKIIISLEFNCHDKHSRNPYVNISFMRYCGDRQFRAGYVLPLKDRENIKPSLAFWGTFSVYAHGRTSEMPDLPKLLAEACAYHPNRAYRITSYFDYYSQWAHRMVSRIPEIHHKLIQQESEAIDKLLLLASLEQIK
jgi:hypothetical protein